MLELFNTMICDMVKEVFANHALISDDGHGWFTQGKRSFTDPVFYENEFNSILEAKLLMLWDICGVEHYQLSPGSLDTELNGREQYEHNLVTDIKARNKKALGVSLHCDGWEDQENLGKQNSAHGFCVYYWERDGSFSVEGKKMARYIADAIIKSDTNSGHVIIPRHDNGIMGANFFMLRETDAPWVLVENAFMTNDKDLRWLRSDRFRNNRAMAVLQGLYDYVKLFKH